MRPIWTAAAVAAALGVAPATADAACPQRTTGTVVGAVTGGLLGSAVAGHGARTEGTLLGAAAGGLVGNQVTKCHYTRRAYHPPPTRSHSASYGRSAYASAGACRYETRAFYDANGQLVYAPAQVCG